MAQTWKVFSLCDSRTSYYLHPSLFATERRQENNLHSQRRIKGCFGAHYALCSRKSLLIILFNIFVTFLV